MKLTFKEIKNFLYKYKKYIFSILVIYLIALFLLFPYEDLVQKILIQIGQQNNSFQFEYESMSIGIFPPRLSLNEVEFITPTFSKSISLDRMVFKPSYLSLIALKLGAKIDLLKGGSSIHIWMQRVFPQKQQQFRIRAYSPRVDTQHFDLISSFFSQSNGYFNFSLNLDVDPTFRLPPEGSFQFIGHNLEFKPYSISRQYIGTINIPLLKWSILNGRMSFSDNRVSIENLRVGNTSDDFYLNLDGFVNINLARFRQSVQEYELDLDLIMNEEFKNQFFFVDLFLSDIEEKTQDNKFQYRTRIAGRSLYPPKIEKREEE